MNFGSLFSGIGGMDLGLERAGMRCLWQVENDEFAQKVLKKHWPHLPRHGDIQTFPPGGDWEPWRCDLLAGGFPCQGISLAGKRLGLRDERSGLWSEFARVVRGIRPKVVLVENTPGLLAPTDRDEQAPIGCVLGELAECGYDAEWACIPAYPFGSTQERFRVFIVAYLASYRNGSGRLSGQRRKTDSDTQGSRQEIDSDINDKRFLERTRKRSHSRKKLATAERVCLPRYPDIDRLIFRDRLVQKPVQSGPRSSGESSGCNSPFVGSGWWGAEPALARMVYGVPRRVVRDPIRGLGSCVIPQVAEWVGRRIMASVLKEA